MSSTQALASGILASTSSARQSSVDRSDSGFRDTLDKESRSRETQGDSGRSQETSHARGSNDRDSNKTKGDSREDITAGDSDRINPSSETPIAGDLSAILAKLGNGQSGEEETGSFEVRADQKPDANPLAELADDVGPMLPNDGSDSLDAEKLMALLKSGLANSSGEDAVDKVDLKVKVAGQETHLALAPQQPGENSEMLVAPQGDAEAQAVVKAQGEGAGNAQVKVASEAQNAVRVGAQDNDTNSPPEMKDGVRTKSVGEQWSAPSGAALSDHGIAGGDGRQSDGRGASSGGNSSQPGSNAFMSLLASVSSQATNAVRDSVAADTIADPVMDQIADGVRAELRADGLLDSSSEGVVKVLSIELKPANLGAVTVRIALKDNTVKVHIEAQRGETLAVIERERDALESALKTAGYSVDGISAGPQAELSRGIGVSPAAATDASAQQGGLPGQASQGQGLGESGQQGHSGHGGSGRSEHDPRPDAKDTNAQGVRAGNNGLYV